MCSGRRITSPLQVIPIINFAPLPGDTAPCFQSFPNKFAAALKRYLRGSGHPVGDEFNPIMSNERQAVANNHTLRSQIFMKSVTGSEYLPLDPGNGISVCAFPSLLFTTQLTIPP
jgi:hypothetical protein